MKRAILASAMLLALGSGTAYAQSPENDEGLYIGGGVGQFDIEIDGLTVLTKRSGVWTIATPRGKRSSAGD